jgi:peroxiredoxin Q/BCP
MLQVNDQAPDFSLSTDSSSKLSLKDFTGQTIVLYFFPKADTPG